MMVASDKISQVSHTGLKLGILLLQPYKCWDYRLTSLYVALLLVFVCEAVQLLSATAFNSTI